jgi:probable rRNA maturation factor
VITIEITEDFRSQVDIHLIEEAVLNSLRQQSASDGTDLSVVISNDEELRSLNRQYRNIDATTDVLSFPADFIDPENENQYLGDIIVSYTRAADQAAAGGHTVMAELQLLVVHGVLHLLGHDHADGDEKTRMWTAQKEILGRLGLDNLKIPEGD